MISLVHITFIFLVHLVMFPYVIFQNNHPNYFPFITFFCWMLNSFKDGPYSGGNCLTAKGTLRQNIVFSERLFNGGLAMEDGPVHLFYSVRKKMYLHLLCYLNCLLTDLIPWKYKTESHELY
jgi:hypothetical protein